MSAAELAQAEILHPTWCRLGEDCAVSSDHAVHHSRGSMIPPAADDSEVTIDLVLHDDIHPGTGENHGTTAVRVTVTSTAFVVEPMSTYLDPAEARMLAALLTRYADRCEFDRAHGGRYPAAEVRE